MSGEVSSYQDKSISGCSELKITVRYEGLKATQYFSKFTPQSEAVFRQDLLILKLPHPKRENTTFISYGCVECFWPSVPKNGVRGILNNLSASGTGGDVVTEHISFLGSSQTNSNQDRESSFWNSPRRTFDVFHVSWAINLQLSDTKHLHSSSLVAKEM